MGEGRHERLLLNESENHLEHVADTGHLILIVAELQPPA